MIKFSKEEYYGDLLSPKWDKKRREIYKRDDYRCINCGASNKELHCHHRFYFFDERIKPWAYDDECLITLCSDCHEKVHKYRKDNNISQGVKSEFKEVLHRGRMLLRQSYRVMTFDDFVFSDGRYKGNTLREVYEKDSGYFKWFIVFEAVPVAPEVMSVFFNMINSSNGIGRRGVRVEYAQVYRGLIRAFDRINSVCALKLLPFLLFEMNDSNVISFDLDLIRKFNSQFSNSFNERTVRNSMTELVKSGIAHKIQNGKYMIDANYCWIGDTAERLMFIKNIESWKANGLFKSGKDDRVFDVSIKSVILK